MFCPKCGTQNADGVQFCQSCGNAMNVTQVVQHVYTKPKIPGRGMGIAGMVLGIIGLVYSAMIAIIALTSPAGILEPEDVASFSSFAIMSILAICFGGAANSKGYKNGISTSALVMGILGLCCYLIMVITAL